MKEMNRIGMLVDLSHVSVPTMNDTLDMTEASVIFSHSTGGNKCEHPRNVPDSVLERLALNQGIVMVTYVPAFVSRSVYMYQNTNVDGRDRGSHLDGPGPKATIPAVADHIDHIRNVCGIDNIGIGGDFDGVETGTEGLEAVSKYHMLTIELIRKKYENWEIKKILGFNILRVMRKVESIANSSDRTPSEALMDKLECVSLG